MESGSRGHRVRDLDGLQVTVIGLAREGAALASYLARQGARVTVSDLKGPVDLGPHLEALAPLPIRFRLGSHPLSLLDADVIFVSPGVPITIPLLAEARKRGVPLSTETRFSTASPENPRSKSSMVFPLPRRPSLQRRSPPHEPCRQEICPS